MDNFDPALAALNTSSLSHPPGWLSPHTARLAWALHSETLTPYAIRASRTPIFSTTPAEDDAPTTPDSLAALQPDCYGTSQGSLTPHTFSERVLRHTKGGLYLELNVAVMDFALAGGYVHLTPNLLPTGPWWIRPWSTMIDGRFHPEPDSTPSVLP